MKRGLLSVFAAVAVALVTGAGVPVSAQEAGNEVLEIRSVALGGCLGATDDGRAWLRVLPCTGGARQEWERIPLTGDRFVLRNRATGDCVWRAGLNTCDDEDTEQRLAFAPDGDGVVKLVDVTSGRVADSTIEDAYGVILRESLDTDHQRWRVTVLPEVVPPPADTTGRVVTIRSVDKGTCVTYVPTVTARLGACSGAADQRWQRVELGDGAFQLRDVRDGRCLQVARHYARATLWDPCDAADARQHWRAEPDLLGSARLRNVHTGGYATPSADGVASYDPWSVRVAQRWVLTAVS